MTLGLKKVTTANGVFDPAAPGVRCRRRAADEFLVKGDQFAVKMVEGSQAEITVAQQFGDGDVSSYTLPISALISEIW